MFDENSIIQAYLILDIRKRLHDLPGSTVGTGQDVGSKTRHLCTACSRYAFHPGALP
jgi:hypothetical protein